jgi:hypothetical protein
MTSQPTRPNRPARAMFACLLILLLFPATRHLIFAAVYNIFMFLVAVTILFILWAVISPTLRQR